MTRSSENRTEKYHTILARCIAPTLRNVKPSSLVSLPQELKIDNIRLAAKNLEMILLYKLKDSQVVFIFNRKMLNNTIDNDKVLELLKSYSYPQDFELGIYLEHLKKRLIDFKENKSGYPHEIGAFLGYPYQDVRDFIERKKACCFSGYWKVFNDPQKALKTMQDYAHAQAQVLYAYAGGKRYFEITGI